MGVAIFQKDYEHLYVHVHVIYSRVVLCATQKMSTVILHVHMYSTLRIKKTLRFFFLKQTVKNGLINRKMCFHYNIMIRFSVVYTVRKFIMVMPALRIRVFSLAFHW